MSTEKAILAGGCFWGMEELFRKLPGVTATRVGYTGGHTPNPTYNDMKTGSTGHAEALEITFDPTRTSYGKILEFFFQIHDPSTKDRQGNDRGTQYRSAIFALSPEQKKTAQDTIDRVNASRKWPGPVVTEVADGKTFYEAEHFHQNYLQLYPDGYTCHSIRPNWKL